MKLPREIWEMILKKKSWTARIERLEKILKFPTGEGDLYICGNHYWEVKIYPNYKFILQVFEISSICLHCWVKTIESPHG